MRKPEAVDGLNALRPLPLLTLCLSHRKDWTFLLLS